MKIAVVTPVYKTPRPWLDQCLASVYGQSVSSTHFLVNDGDEALAAADFPGVEFIDLPGPHNDYGNWARAIGSCTAISHGADAIAYLDADNWFETDHLREMLTLHEKTGAAICTAARNLVDLDGRLLGVCPEVDGENFVDTSCLFLAPGALGLASIWYGMPRELSAIGDRVFWKAVKVGKYSRAHRRVPTVNYRTNYQAHYVYFGTTPPIGAKCVVIKKSPAGEFLAAHTYTVEPAPLPGPISLTRFCGPGRGSEISATSPGRTGPASSLSRRPRVSLCMIVKDEEKNLADCLSPVAHLFDETIVVDTGSTDATKAIAGRLGAKVYDFAWADSFAVARNESLMHATGDWVFWLDADERLDETNLERLRHLLSELPPENHAYMMCQRSLPDRLTGATLVVDQVRLFRNLPAVRWRYRCHEQLPPALKEQGAKEVDTAIVIQHMGYQDHELRLRKRKRNLRLLGLDLRQDPCDPFVLFNIANAHLEEGQIQGALQSLHCSLTYAPPHAAYRSKVYRQLAECYHGLGRDEEALRYCREGRKMFPQAAGIWFQEGVLFLTHGDLTRARACFETILALPAERHYAGAGENLTGSQTRHNLAVVYLRLGLRENAEEQWLRVSREPAPFEPAWLGLLELYLEQNRRRDAEGLLARLAGKPYQQAIQPALEARLALARGDSARARQVLEDAVLRAPNGLWLRSLLVDILLRVARDDAAAEQHLRAILALTPNDVQARRKLADVRSRNSSGPPAALRPPVEAW